MVGTPVSIGLLDVMTVVRRFSRARYRRDAFGPFFNLIVQRPLLLSGWV
jgi:hypothetical protein